VTGDRDEFDEPVRIGNLRWLPDEHTFEDLDPVGTWRHRLDLMKRAGNTAEVERMLTAGPPPGDGPSPSTFAPVVLALEVGGDPGGAIALALAARQIKRLSLIIAMGGPESARFSRHLLDLLGRPDVAVVQSSAPSTLDLSITGLVPPDVPKQSDDVISAVRAVVGHDPYLVLWGNTGPLTDLAAVLRDDPALAGRLRASIAAGPLDAATPPFASDPTSAALALATVRTPSVEAHHPESAVSPTFPTELLAADPTPFDIGADSPVRRSLAAPEAPAWVVLLSHHLDQWFSHGHSASSQYPALMIASVLNRPLMKTSYKPVAADGAGSIRIDATGVELRVTVAWRNHFIEFQEWLLNQLREAIEGSAQG
jgi:hypothetical protein